MKRILFSIIPILLSGLCFAQTDISNIYQSFHGGSGSETPSGFIDLNEGLFLGFGTTDSDDMEVIDAFQPQLNGPSDGYMTIIDEFGYPLFSSYLGGSENDDIKAAVFNSNSEILIAGSTVSSDFPILNDDGTAFGGNSMGYILKLDQNYDPMWCTFVGGDNFDEISDVSVDNEGNIYVAGRTNSTGLGTTGVFQSDLGNDEYGGGFLAKYSNEGEKIWYTYLEGEAAIEINSVSSINSSDPVFIYGMTRGVVYVDNPGHQVNFGGGIFDCILASFNSSTGALNWFTYYGGDDDEFGFDFALDGDQNIYITGNTGSANNISSAGSFQEDFAGSDDFFLAKFNSIGERQWGTYFGASGQESTVEISEIYADNFYIKGQTMSEQGMAFGNPILDEVDLPSVLASPCIAQFDVNGNLNWSTYAPLNSYQCSSLRGLTQFDNKIYSFGVFSNPQSVPECSGITPDAYQPSFAGGQSDFGIFIFEDNTLNTRNYEPEPLEIYPNPTTDFITIQAPSLLWAGMDLTVMDVSGRMVDQVINFQSGNQYNTAELSDGVYVVIGSVDDRFFRQKLIISK